MIQTYCYPQFSAVVYAAKFERVRNACATRSRIIEAARLVGAHGDAEREAVNFAFINAKLITSILHLQTAIHQALLSQSQGMLRTKTIHSEIIWALSQTNNISEAIKLFGISDESEELILVHVATSHICNVQQKMEDIIEGDMVPMSVISESTSWIDVEKHYKLSLDGELALKDYIEDDNRKRSIINIVVSMVAMKSVMA